LFKKLDFIPYVRVHYFNPFLSCHRSVAHLAAAVPQSLSMAHQRRRRTRLRNTATTDVSITFTGAEVAVLSDAPTRPRIPVRSVLVRTPQQQSSLLSLSEVNDTALAAVQHAPFPNLDIADAPFDTAGNGDGDYDNAGNPGNDTGRPSSPFS